MTAFFHSTKSDAVHGVTFAIHADLVSRLRSYMPYYNGVRLHSGIGYSSPVAYEAQFTGPRRVSTKPREHPGGLAFARSRLLTAALDGTKTFEELMSDHIETRFTRDYGVRHPIALAPMAFVGTAPDLAIGVSKAGGLGSLAVGPLSAEAVRGLIKAFKAATDGPLNVNFITFLANRAQIEACIDEDVAVVSFHWGHPPREFIDALHEADVKVWEQVGSVTAAKEAVDTGIDLIIAQGSEAGGHNYGSLPTFVLLPSIIEAIAPTPVVAAGGIATGRQLAAALVLGADAVSIGTRFVASNEAFAHTEYKRRLVEAEGTETRLSSIYGPNLPHFNPMRVLDVGLAHAFAGREEAAAKDLQSQPIIGTMKLAGETIPLRRFTSFVPTPDTEGHIDELPFLAGQGVGLIHDVNPVAKIIDGIMAEAASRLSAFHGQ